MRTLSQILRRILQSRWYYLGTFASMISCWLLGPAQPESDFPYLPVALAFFVASLVCGGLLLHQNRARFVARDDVTRAAFLRALLWFYTKILVLLAALAAPFFVPVPWIASTEETSWSWGFEVAETGTAFVLFFLATTVVVVVHNGAAALVVARGHAQYCVRDSLRSFRYLWRDIFFALALMLVPGLLSTPFRIFSFYVPLATWLVVALQIATVPYQFALANGAFLYFGHRLRELAPELAEQPALRRPRRIFSRAA